MILIQHAEWEIDKQRSKTTEKEVTTIEVTDNVNVLIDFCPYI